MVNSPVTELSAAINDTATTITVLNGAALPDAPNLATIGQGDNAETIMYAVKTGNTLTDVVRGFQGSARAWPANSKIARNFTAYDYDAMREMLEQGQTIPAPIQRGVNVINSDQPSGATIKVSGRTLVNILGRDGGCESLAPFTTSGTVTLNTVEKRSGNSSVRVADGVFYKDYAFTLDPAKQYFIGAWMYIHSFTSGANFLRLCDVGTQTSRYSTTPSVSTGMIGTWQFIYSKIPTSNALVGNGFRLMFGAATTALWDASIDEIRLYEVSAAEYAAIGTTITGAEIDARWPYVDSVQPLRGVNVSLPGKNLLNGVPAAASNGAWTLVEPYKFNHVRTASGQAQELGVATVKSNQQYTIKLNKSAGVINHTRLIRSDGTYVNAHSDTNSDKITFTTNADTVRVAVLVYTNTNATYEVSNWMLVLGDASNLPASFEPYSPRYAHAPVDLYSNVDRTIYDSYDSATGQVFRRWGSISFDGSEAWEYRNDNGNYVTASLEISTPPPYRKSIGNMDFYVRYGNEEMIPIIGQIDNVSQSYLDRLLATIYGSTVISYGVIYLTIPKFALSSQNAAGVKAYLAAKAAAGNPLTLDYVRATPVVEQLTGDLGGLDVVSGGNTVELLEGVVVRERVYPQLASGEYRINTTTAGKISRRVLSILNIYRGMVADNRWRVVTRAESSTDVPTYGYQWAGIAPSDYDPDAEYFVDYIVLDRYAYTANVIDATLTYQSTLGGAVAQATQDIAALKQHNGVQDWAIDWTEAKADNVRFDLDAHISAPANAHAASAISTTGGGNVQQHVSSTSNPHNTTAQQVGAIPAGTGNASISVLQALLMPTDTRNWLATAWDGDDNPTTIQIRNGSTVVCTLTMTYEDGNLKTLTAADGTRTITWTLTWTAGRFVSFTKAVT